MATDESQTRSYFVTFSATASTTGTTELELPEGYLTELTARVEGTITTTDVSGGPVRLSLWLRRGQSYRKLCEGGIQSEYTVKGSGQLRVKKGDAVVCKWTEVSGSAVIVRVDAFMDERSLGTGAPGWHDETPVGSWLYQARRSNTQDGAGGGALGIRITFATSQACRLIRLLAVGPVTNTTLIIRTVDEDGASGPYVANYGAAASIVASLPGLGGAATASGNTIASLGMEIGPGEGLQLTAAAAAQTESLTVAPVFLLTFPVAPTWATTGSAGTPNLGASSISAANTWAFLPGVTL